VDEARRLGYDVLLNEHRVVRKNGASIVLAGVTDPSGGQFLPSHASDPALALRGAPGGTVKILLAHQPRTILETGSLGVDLILSGHTHGGQFFPWNLVATLAQPYIEGLHLRDGTWIYVSKGTGYWGPPVRLGARSEITVVTLRAAAA
jgi:predicted MPP superfamily phosphohydrolase